MEKIDRPQEIGNQETILQSDKNRQEYTEEQFNGIYDYLDELVTNFNNINVLDQVYPVGSIYISINKTNPSTFIGGTWEQISANYYLMASANGGGGTSGSNTKDISHTHTLNCSLASNKGTGNGVAYTAGSYVWNGTNAISTYTNKTLNIQPASIAVCMWKRTK